MSYHLPDAPAIRAAERFGTEKPEDCCPICGAACEEIYHFSDGRPAGCNVCDRRESSESQRDESDGNFMLSWGLFPSLRKER